MNDLPGIMSSGGSRVESFDVVVVGAGISGISIAHYLRTVCPDLSFVILERRDTIGGTWSLFQYPGIRWAGPLFSSSSSSSSEDISIVAGKKMTLHGHILGVFSFGGGVDLLASIWCISISSQLLNASPVCWAEPVLTLAPFSLPTFISSGLIQTCSRLVSAGVHGGCPPSS